MGAAFLLTKATLSENPQLIQDFGKAVRKSWLLPEGIWHQRISKESCDGVLVPYELIDFRNQSKISDPKRFLSWKGLTGRPPLSILSIPAGEKVIILCTDGKEAAKSDAFLTEVRSRRAVILRKLYLPFAARTDQEEKKKLDWLKKEEAITEEEYQSLTAELSLD